MLDLTQAEPVYLVFVSLELCGVWGGASRWPVTATVSGQWRPPRPARTANQGQSVRVSLLELFLKENSYVLRHFYFCSFDHNFNLSVILTLY